MEVEQHTEQTMPRPAGEDDRRAPLLPAQDKGDIVSSVAPKPDKLSRSTACDDYPIIVKRADNAACHPQRRPLVARRGLKLY